MKGFWWARGELYAVETRGGRIVRAAEIEHPEDVQDRLYAALEAAAKEILRATSEEEQLDLARLVQRDNEDGFGRPAYLGDFDGTRG